MMNPDELARLEEERNFLLDSLRDVERERAAGDIDDEDYATLKSGYTQRAANVLKAIEAGQSTLSERAPKSRAKAIVVSFSIVAFSSLLHFKYCKISSSTLILIDVVELAFLNLKNVHCK